MDNFREIADLNFTFGDGTLSGLDINRNSNRRYITVKSESQDIVFDINGNMLGAKFDHQDEREVPIFNKLSYIDISIGSFGNITYEDGDISYVYMYRNGPADNAEQEIAVFSFPTVNMDTYVEDDDEENIGWGDEGVIQLPYTDLFRRTQEHNTQLHITHDRRFLYFISDQTNRYVMYNLEHNILQYEEFRPGYRPINFGFTFNYEGRNPYMYIHEYIIDLVDPSDTELTIVGQEIRLFKYRGVFNTETEEQFGEPVIYTLPPGVDIQHIFASGAYLYCIGGRNIYRITSAGEDTLGNILELVYNFSDDEIYDYHDDILAVATVDGDETSLNIYNTSALP